MKIYWTQSNLDFVDEKVMRANSDGSDVEELVTTAQIPNPHGFRGIALGPQSGKLYWSSHYSIWRSNLDGTDIEAVLNNAFSWNFFIAVDESGGGKIYWVDPVQNAVSRANLDGTDIEELVGPGDLRPFAPTGIALDVQNQNMYITSNINGILRANLDGTNVEEIVPQAVSPQGRGLALDLTNGHMYWTDVGTHTVSRSNLDGTNIETLATNQANPFGIALSLDEGKIYWATFGHGGAAPDSPGSIHRADLDGANAEVIVSQDLSGAPIRPYGIAVGELAQRHDYRFEYAAKLLCGIQRDPEDMRLAPGFYATTINIHNPHGEPVSLFKKLALTYPPGEQRPGQIIPIAIDQLGPDEALAVDCVDIRNRLFPEGFPTSYIEGFVVIQSPESLDVTAVYTTAAVDERGNVTSHSSIHVEQVRERDRARAPEAATDLLIRKEAIVPPFPVSTTIVQYKIHVLNQGPAAAQNVVVSDTLQVQPGTLISVPEATFSATHGGVWSLGQVTPSSAELEATIPVLPATEHAVLEFAVLVQVDFTTLQAELKNTASVTSDTVELDPSNNSVVVTTLLNP
jgi:hypothetical protein